MPNNMSNPRIQMMMSQMSDNIRGWLRGKYGPPDLTGTGSVRFSDDSRSRVLIYNTEGLKIGTVTRRSTTVHDPNRGNNAMTRIINSPDFHGGEMVFHVLVSGDALLNLNVDLPNGQTEASFTFPEYVSALHMVGAHEYMVLFGYCIQFNLMALD